MKKTILLACIILSMAACKNGQKEETRVIDKPNIEIKDGVLSPEVLWSMGRISDVSVSPDQKKITFGIKYFSIAENKGNTDIYSMNIDGSDLQRLTKTSANEFNAIWRPDGKKIGYISTKSGAPQIWEMNPDGSDKKQISNIEEGLEAFRYAPDQKHVYLIKSIKVNKSTSDIYPDLDKTSGIITSDLMYKHWDEWVKTVPHIFVADYDEKNISNETDILEGEPFEAPLRPFGGIEQVSWSPDSKKIAYTSRKLTGKAYALSTNSDIYIYDITTKETQNISKGIMGYDKAPVFSPDGKYIAWESMERDGYEADKDRLMVYDFASGEIKDYTKDFDQNANGLAWSEDGKYIYFISDHHAVDDIYRLDLASGEIITMTEGVHDYTSVIPAGEWLIGTKMSMKQPIEIYAVHATTKEEKQLSFVNKDILDQLKDITIQKRWIKTTDNKDMLTWVILPPDFDSTKTYPTILYCEGGPQSTVSQFWSFRWNFRIMASQGYIIVAPNRRGLPGFGQEWLEQISGDYGGQNMKDYLSAIDAVSKEKYVDANHLGCIGASYGGFSVYWLAGHHENRFKAFIAHCGIFNLEQMYLETEELWFTNWDLGGPYWDKSNKIAQRSYANSPHLFVEKWNTPIMVIHGEKDYRILASQGMSAFNAAVIRGIPAELLIFPDENHWVLQPQNGILWQRRFFNWLDKWLK